MRMPHKLARLFTKSPTKNQLQQMKQGIFLIADAMGRDKQPTLQVIYELRGRRYQINVQELIPKNESD